MANKIYTDNNSEYLKNNPTWHTEDSAWKATQITKLLKRNELNPKTIAEIGCGAGEILNQLHLSMPNDVNLTGFDISSDAINIAKEREKERLTFKHEDFLYTSENFDLLLMMDVFEHVDDYLGFLKLCNNKAKNTVFHIPLDITVMGLLTNSIMHRRKTLSHLHYFTKDTAIATLNDSGFEIIDFFYTEWFFDFKERRKSIGSKILYLIRKGLYKINKDFAVKMFGGVSLIVLTK
ncbi:class I SAM-dependent methyltransferase [Flavobacterium sp.]|uniref:class I SAM-dependent methyltransferase n=1 Tax=Flavobacterium sp. TaxID=239 RepID=UPI00391CDCC2